MPAIHVLPETLVDQIAAGEVIERPASVVKELVENSLDAGARSLTVEVEGGGVARVSVLDDGCGMEPGDARLALQRHATSKIRSFSDLQCIGSLGFRGEALPSIASVSRLVLTTSPDGSGLGTRVLAERGATPRISPASHPKGTRLLVEDLFGNVPARRKFLKSPGAELRAVVRALSALALSRPAVAFTLGSAGRRLLDLPTAPNLSARFVEILGREALGDVGLVSLEAFGIRLSGVVSRPAVTFASRTHQWIFVNGRAVKDAALSHAAALAAKDVLRSDRHPAFALFLELDPSLCDVNVHPQKREVRFRDPSTVHSVVHRGLAAALGGAQGATVLEGRRLEIKAGPAAALAEAIGIYGGGMDSPALSSQASLVSAPAVLVARSAYPESAEGPSPLGPLRVLGQYRDSFLVAEGSEGLVLVDQHVAHERVRYERILSRHAGGGMASQGLLLPVSFEASPEEAGLLDGAQALLERAGFLVSGLSGRTFLVSAVPRDCPAAAVAPFLRDFLGRLADSFETGERMGESREKEVMAASLACRGAITVNTPLKLEEVARLLGDLAACGDPFTCPHGRPILLALSHGEVLRRFGRRP